MKRAGLIVALLALSFACTRAVRSAQLQRAGAVTTTPGTGPLPAPVRRATTAQGRHPTMTARPFESEIHATAVESSEARDLRHEGQLAQIHQRALDLPAAITDNLVSIADRVAEQTLNLRTSFLLDELTEDDYLENRRAAIREGFHAARAVLTKDQFARVFQWSSDADPFDPDGSTAPRPGELTTSP